MSDMAAGGTSGPSPEHTSLLNDTEFLESLRRQMLKLSLIHI